MMLRPATPIFRDFRRLVAPEIPEPPPAGEFFERWLGNGAGRPCLFLPFLGEFGHLVMTHLRMVHFHRAAEKVVCCRSGQQVLFPSASRFVTNWTDPVLDGDRVGTMSSPAALWRWIVADFPDHQAIECGGLHPEHEVWALRPHQPIRFRPRRRGLRADVVLGVRRRELSPERNWPHWHRLADRLRDAGLSFAVIGDKKTSFDLDGQACHSGDLDTDAAIELLQNCRLYVGSDTGSAHLAATVGCRMLIFRHPSGNFTERMKEVNPAIEVLPADAWVDPLGVAGRAIALARS